MRAIIFYSILGIFSCIICRSYALCLTVDEVLLLKQNGISEKTIQLMIQSELYAQQQLEKNPYNTMGIREIKRPDGKSSIVYSTGKTEDTSLTQEEMLKEQRAWEMLKSLIIDTRTR